MVPTRNHGFWHPNCRLQLPDQVRTDIALTLLWHIWKARNAKILEQEPPAREVIYLLGYTRLCFSSYKSITDFLKKLGLRGARPPPRHCIKKKTFSHRPVLWHETGEKIFLQQQTTRRAIRRSTTSHTCVCRFQESNPHRLLAQRQGLPTELGSVSL
jgi:hypothetical protein